MWFIDLIDHLALTIGVGRTGFFGYLAARSSNLSKQQVTEIKDELQGIKEDVEDVKDLGTDNKGQISMISELSVSMVMWNVYFENMTICR